jgi:hypothetical protein
MAYPSPPARQLVRAARILTVAFALLGPACEDDFAPYNRIDKLRVLAIQSEPVELTPGGMVTLRPLVYVPPGQSVSLAWSWCPVAGSRDTGSACLATPEELAAATGAASPSFELGTGGTAQLAADLPPGLVRGLCAGRLGDRDLPLTPDCKFGLPLTIRLEARTGPAEAPTDRVVAIHKLNLRLDEGPVNLNPAVPGLVLDPEANPRPMDDSGEAVLVAPGSKLSLGVVIPLDSAETYPGRPSEGEPPSARERLVFTWFVELGETRFQRTSFIDGVIPLEQAARNRWDLPLAHETSADSARLIVVVRDNRGGVSWRTGRVRLGDLP